MKIFLKLKAWQLFLLGFLLSLISLVDSKFDIIFYLLYLGWPWAIATNLFKLLPQNTDMKLIKFKISMMIFLTILMVSYFAPLEQKGNFLVSIIVVILGCSILYSFFYTIYFIAKELKSIELQRVAKWSDYNDTFFLLLFNQIGIWWIQPRINKLFSKDESGVL